MKKFFFNANALKSSVFCLGLAAAACTLTLYSCDNGDDDDDEDDPSGLFVGTLGDAPYEADAVKYTVTGNAEIGSIELTSSGNYLVLPPEADAQPEADLPSKTSTTGTSYLKKQEKALSRYIHTNRCFFGTFTKDTDGSYTLKDYGTLSVAGNNLLKLVKTDGSPITTLSVEKLPAITGNSLNNRFCRTWHPVSATLKYYDTNDKLLHTEIIDSPEDLQEDYINYIVVSKSGSFFQVDYDGSMDGYGSWKWTDTEKQIFQFQWLDEEYPDGGSEQVSFNDATAYFQVSYSDMDDNEQIVKVQETVKCQALN